MSKLKLLLCILLMFVFVTNIFASCEDEDLLHIADEAKVYIYDDKEITYQLRNEAGEMETTVIPRSYGYVLLMYPYNERIRMEVSDKDSAEEYPVQFSYKYLSTIMGATYHYDEKNYTIKYYSNDKNSCYGEVLKTFNLTVPPYNNYSSTEFCKEHSEHELCRIYTKTEDLTPEEIEEMRDEIIKAEMNSSQIALLYIKKYWLYVLLPIIIVSIYYRIKISNYKRKAEEE